MNVEDLIAVLHAFLETFNVCEHHMTVWASIL